MNGVVIVGAGTAGVSAATTLRSAGYEGPVTLIGAEPGAPYRRTALTKDLLAADLAPERIALQKPNAWSDKGIDLVSGVSVAAVHPDAQTVATEDGRVFAYDALILATGGRAARPAWLAADTPTVRTLPEALAVRAAITEAGRVAVIGGGLIGLEIAASAAVHGLQTRVVEAAHSLLARSVPPPVAEWFRALHERNGVVFEFGARVAEAAPHRILFDDGRVSSGPVVAAVGMRPDCRLAELAGATIGEAGVVVDGAFATDVPGVYAAGDAAAVPDPITGRPSPGGHWFGATDQGAAAARAVVAASKNETVQPFREVPRAWTIQYGVNVQTVGWPAVGGDIEIDGSLDDNDATVRVNVDGRLTGAVTVGRAAAARACRAEIQAALGSTV